MLPVRPYEYARELISRFNLDSVPVDIEAVAKRLGITVNYFDNPNTTNPECHKTLMTACAWLDKSQKAMYIYKDMPLTRQRLSIAHEIMHYLNPYHACISPFSGDDTTPYVNLKPQERQAYEGGLWLLFLCDRFTERVRDEKPGLDLINQLAHEHVVSQEATAMWYVRLATCPCAFVVAEPIKATQQEQNGIFAVPDKLDKHSSDPITLNSGRQIAITPHGLQVKYAAFSDSVSRKPFMHGRGIPSDSPICQAIRTGRQYTGPISGQDLGFGHTTETYECECSRFGVPGEYKTMALAWLDSAQDDLF